MSYGIYTIAMFSVIADHLKGKASIELNIQGWFHYPSFHMPLFMFSAGYFFKIKNINYTCDYIIRKFRRLILPIYIYNIFYGFYIQFLKKLGFRNNIRPFTFRIIFIEPLGGCGFQHIHPSWFSSSLFFVEMYNITKRKLISYIKKEQHESIYFMIDGFISSVSVILANKGYNKFILSIHILRFLHLNIYYQFGILFRKHLELFFKNIKTDLYYLFIFMHKLCIHIYYAKMPVFFYGGNYYFNYSPYTVIIVSILGILFWLRTAEVIEPILGNNFYINIIADNTFSIMMNHFLAIDIVKACFYFISQKTKYCKDFDLNRYYSMDFSYIYIPYNILQIGIIYILNCFFLPIIIQKIINKIKNKIFKI